MSNPDNPATKLISAALMQSAEKMGIKLEPLEIREPGDLDRVFAAMVGCDAVLIQFDPITFNLRWQVAALAARHQLLAIYDNRDCVTAGGLISYGADLKESFRLGGSLVDRILRGARAKDLPVEQPSRFQLVINLNAAKAIGLTIPSSLLARADEVIE